MVYPSSREVYIQPVCATSDSRKLHCREMALFIRQILCIRSSAAKVKSATSNVNYCMTV